MPLISLTLQNFRCFGDAIRIPIHQLTVFIGENDAGKTGILDAVTFLVSSGSLRDTDFRIIDREQNQRAEEVVISGDFHVPGAAVPENWRTDEANVWRLTKVYRNDGVKCFVEGQTFADSRFAKFDQHNASTQKELLRELGFSPPGSNEERRQEQLAAAAADGRLAKTRGQVEVAFGQVVPLLPRLEVVASAEFRDPDSMVARSLRQVVERCIRPTDDAGTPQLLANLVGVEAEIAQALNAEASKIGKSLTAVYPNIKRVEVKPVIDFARSLSSTSLLVDVGDGLQPVTALGEGTKKKLWMGLLDWERRLGSTAASQEVIRLFDEPDVNLDYAAERKLFRNIVDSARAEDSRVQALVCTHSITLVDRAPAESINLIRVNATGERRVEWLNGDEDDEVREFLGDIGRSVGLMNSALFYERAYLIVEGESEEEAIPILYQNLFRTSLIEDGIVLINLFTSGAWKAVLKVLRQHKSACTVLMLDADCTRPNASGNITPEALEAIGFPAEFRSNSCFYIGTKEFEDSFATADIVAVLNASWPRGDGKAWQAGDVDRFRGEGVKFSDCLVRQVRTTCVPQQRSRARKPELARHLARHCMAEEQIPQSIRDALAGVRTRAGAT